MVPDHEKPDWLKRKPRITSESDPLGWAEWPGDGGENYLKRDCFVVTRLLLLKFLLLTVAFIDTRIAHGQASTPQMTTGQIVRLKEAARLETELEILTIQGKFAQAVPLAKQVVEINKEVRGEKNVETAISLNNLGFYLDEAGDDAAAKSIHEQALAIRKELLGDRHAHTALSLYHLGAVLRDLGDRIRSRSCQEQSLAIYRELFGDQDIAIARGLRELGRLRQDAGDYPEARKYHEQALAIYRKVVGEKNIDSATTLTHVAAALDAMGNHAEARTCFEKALAIRKEVLEEGHPHIAASLSNLANSYQHSGDLETAVAYYEESLAAFRKNGSQTAVATVLSNLASLLNTMHDSTGALAHYQEALTIRKRVFGEKHNSTARSLSDVGTLLLAKGDYGAAEPYLVQALAIRREALGDGHPEFAISLSKLGELYAAMENWSEAIRLLDESRHVVRKYITSILPALSEQEQLLFLDTHDRLSLNRSLSLGLLRRKDPRAAAASAGWLLNSKCISQETRAVQAVVSRESPNESTRANIQKLTQVREQLAALTLGAHTRSTSSRKARLLELERQEDELSRQLASAETRSRQTQGWVEIEELRKRLSPQEVLINIARIRVYNFTSHRSSDRWRDDHYVAWIIPPSGDAEIKLIDLGVASMIDQVVRELSEASHKLFSSDHKSAGPKATIATVERFDTALLRLSTDILHPLMKDVGAAKTITISPDGNLWLVPWAALLLTDGRYAIQEYQIRNLVSCRELLAPAGSNAAARPLIMANPDYDLSPTDRQRFTLAILNGVKLDDNLNQPSDVRPNLPRRRLAAALPGTEKAAKLIAPKLATFAGKQPAMFVGQYALEGVIKAVHSPKVVLLQTHGMFLPDREFSSDDELDLASSTLSRSVLSRKKTPIENPLSRGGVLLAGCNYAEQPDGEDGILTGVEILGIDLRGTELVVLCACDSGRGEVRCGEGLAGLRQAFQLAGARAVVATLWSVTEEDSSLMMTDFFSQLSEGKSKFESLRNAQLAAIKRMRDKYSVAHPLMWAAFTITGI